MIDLNALSSMTPLTTPVAAGNVSAPAGGPAFGDVLRDAGVPLPSGRGETPADAALAMQAQPAMGAVIAAMTPVVPAPVQTPQTGTAAGTGSVGGGEARGGVAGFSGAAAGTTAVATSAVSIFDQSTPTARGTQGVPAGATGSAPASDIRQMSGAGSQNPAPSVSQDDAAVINGLQDFLSAARGTGTALPEVAAETPAAAGRGVPVESAASRDNVVLPQNVAAGNVQGAGRSEGAQVPPAPTGAAATGSIDPVRAQAAVDVTPSAPAAPQGTQAQTTTVVPIGGNATTPTMTATPDTALNLAPVLGGLGNAWYTPNASSGAGATVAAAPSVTTEGVLWPWLRTAPGSNGMAPVNGGGAPVITASVGDIDRAAAAIAAEQAAAAASSAAALAAAGNAPVSAVETAKGADGEQVVDEATVTESASAEDETAERVSVDGETTTDGARGARSDGSATPAGAEAGVDGMATPVPPSRGADRNERAARHEQSQRTRKAAARTVDGVTAQPGTQPPASDFGRVRRNSGTAESAGVGGVTARARRDETARQTVVSNQTPFTRGTETAGEAAATAPARPATPAEPVSAVGQVAESLAMQVREGQSEAVLKLRPDALGEVRIQMREGQDGLVIRIEAELGETGDLLRERAGELRDLLAGRQVSVAEVHVLHNPPAVAPAPSAEQSGAPAWWNETPEQQPERGQPEGGDGRNGAERESEDNDE